MSSNVVEDDAYSSLNDLKLEIINQDGDVDAGFSLCFWLYLPADSTPFPSTLLRQHHSDSTSVVPFLVLTANKELVLYPIHFLPQEAPFPSDVTPQTEIPSARSKTEVPLNKWVHVGCEVSTDTMRLHINGEIVGEMCVTCTSDILRKVSLVGANDDSIEGYVHGVEFLPITSSIKDYFVKDPPVQLHVDSLSATDFEEDSDGVWSVVGGKASCRRNFSLDVVLMDAFGNSVNKEMEVTASLTYADNGAHIEKPDGAEAPLLTSYDGIEFASWDRPSKLINGRASFKLKISQQDDRLNVEGRLETHEGTYNSSSDSDSSEATNSCKSLASNGSPVSDLTIFKYCLGTLTEKSLILKDLASAASEQDLMDFAVQVSQLSGCLHHRNQIRISKRMIEEGTKTWNLISENNRNVLWDHMILVLRELFMKVVCCRNRFLAQQDFEVLRRIGGCQESVTRENFEKLWCWLYPVAFALSQNGLNEMWDSRWIEGLVTKEEAESSLQGPGGGLVDPGTFVLRFPTSRSWPHPDAGNLIVTYVGSDLAIHHRLLSVDFFDSCGVSGKSLKEMLLEERELSRLGRITRSLRLV